MKRGRIYAAARREGYNVLALGQHLDDLAESFFMSVFHNGRLRTMKAAYKNKEGDLKIIRPLVYAREKSLRNFAEGSKLPIIAGDGYCEELDFEVIVSLFQKIARHASNHQKSGSGSSSCWPSRSCSSPGSTGTSRPPSSLS